MKSILNRDDTGILCLGLNFVLAQMLMILNTLSKWLFALAAKHIEMFVHGVRLVLQSYWRDVEN